MDILICKRMMVEFDQLQRHEAFRHLHRFDWNIEQAMEKFIEGDMTIHSDNSYINDIKYSFRIPDLYKQSNHGRSFMVTELMANLVMEFLKKEASLNWWDRTNIKDRLHPIATIGDGNCLLHSISISIWGFHDFALNLRSALYEFIKNPDFSFPLYRRWRYQEAQMHRETGLNYSTWEWTRDWLAITHAPSSKPLSGTKYMYESLEEVHIFAMANIIRRPIVVVAPKMLKNSLSEDLSPIPIRGIYLPFLMDIDNCIKDPVFIGYENAHFTSLVVEEKILEDTMPEDEINTTYSIPLTDKDGHMLPIHFLTDPGPDYPSPLIYKCIEQLLITVDKEEQRTILSKYMNVIEHSGFDNDASHATKIRYIKDECSTIPCVQFKTLICDSHKNLKKKFFDIADEHVYELICPSKFPMKKPLTAVKKGNRVPMDEPIAATIEAMKCINGACLGIGNSATAYMCKPCSDAQISLELRQHIEIFKLSVGKSTFYCMNTDGDKSLHPPSPNQVPFPNVLLVEEDAKDDEVPPIPIGMKQIEEGLPSLLSEAPIPNVVLEEKPEDDGLPALPANTESTFIDDLD